MAFIKLPKNQSIKLNYTALKEGYVYLKTNEPYVGYYYEINGRTFAGRTFSSEAPEIIKFDANDNNALLRNPDTEMYAKLSGMTVNDKVKITSLPFSFEDTNVDWAEPIDELPRNRYFIRHIITGVIQHVDQDTYKRLSIDPLYQAEILYSDKNDIDEMDKRMPGLKSFLVEFNL